MKEEGWRTDPVGRGLAVDEAVRAVRPRGVLLLGEVPGARPLVRRCRQVVAIGVDRQLLVPVRNGERGFF